MKTAVISASLVAALAVAGCGSSSSGSNKSSGSASSSGSGSATTKQAAASTCPHNPVRFGVEPYDAGPALQKAYKTVAAGLSAKLGCKVQLIISNSYVAEIEAMRGDQLEIGEFGPLGYVFAHQAAKAQPLATFGTPAHKPSTYTAGIWAPKSSSITSVKGLKGHTLALADTSSTSGALYPIYALEQNGFHCTGVAHCDGVTLRYAGGHAESMLALVHGTADASEVNSQQQTVATKSGEFKPANFRQIWKSDPIYNDPITVRGDLPAAFQARVKQALLSLSASQLAAADTELGSGGAAKMVPAPNSLYQGITALANREGLSTKNLG